MIANIAAGFVATFRVARLTLQTRKIWWTSRPTVTGVTSDPPECKEPQNKKKKMKRNARKNEQEKIEKRRKQKHEKMKRNVFFFKKTVKNENIYFLRRQLETFFKNFNEKQARQ